ncbi:MAG: hypothetical protein HZB44_10900 [Actinobacteria bacterium]|nr:hypothetical protein [Actinomycetota bacterium]
MVARKRRFKGPILITLAILAVILLSVLLVKGIVEKRRENVADLREGIAASRTTAGGQSGAGESGQSGQDGSQPSDAEGEVDDAAADDGAAPLPDGGEADPIPVTILEITSQRVTPFQVVPGQQIAWGATVSGAASVSMNAINTDTGSSVFANLVSGPDNNGTANWSAEGAAPADPGDWYYSTTAISADGSAVRREGSYFRVLP